jgi:nitrate reductase alpha subunit
MSSNSTSYENKIENVSAQIFEHLLTELVLYSNNSCASSDDSTTNEETKTVAAEMSAAKLERMGYAVGYRLTERLAQTKTWNALQSQQDAAQQTAAQQLEAVKFLCKEVWVQLFGKQIDKLQTNHRGVFVLKDLHLHWLDKFPETEAARVTAIQLLAYPCGIVRGCLADLGIPAVVSCDFLADGQNMSCVSFNIKVK